MGIAGLWSWWKSPKGETIHSYTMLTINAKDHALMCQFHKPADEKRMVVVLPPERYRDWLRATPEHSRNFLAAYTADALIAVIPPLLAMNFSI
jgi:putative SOS response-associated peptidase YedK